jgi:hypothetical protein
MSITVRNDDGLRLAGTALAAGDWPAREQVLKPYKPHRVAEHAQRHFHTWAAHPAVQAVDALVGQGEGLNALYNHALNNDWPSTIDVAAFRTEAQPEAFWAETQADWTQAENDAREVLGRADLGQFLADVFGPTAHALVVTPNLLFPGLHFIAVHSATEVVLCAPPPKAWGTSPPWRFNERPDEVLAAFCEGFARHLLEIHLPAAHATLLPHAGTFALAAAVLFLRQAEGDAAGDQFMIVEKRTRNLPKLPAVVMTLEGLLAARRAGKYAGLTDYLPNIAGQFA